MSGRELVILLLGLAIVAVVLRGLYVALNARRGQIKLAIDKNIPQNVDLEALEMAELPGGGARVVTRSLEEVNRKNSALDKAESKARAVNLADDAGESHIPVLMDAVELSEPVRTPPEVAEDSAPPAQAEELPEWEDAVSDLDQDETLVAPQMPLPEDLPEELDDIDDGDEPFPHHSDQAPSIGEDWEESDLSDDIAKADRSADESFDEAAEQEEDPDAVLFDYEEDEEDEDDARLERKQEDLMSSVAPDYEQAADDAEAEVQSLYREPDEVDHDDEPDASSEQFTEEEDEPAAADESAGFDADEDIEEFSMTAGERIGGNPPALGEVRQTGLFDDDEPDLAAAVPPAKKSRSLFGMFGRKTEKEEQQEPAELQTEQYDELQAEEYAEPESEAPEADDVLMGESALPEEESLDELDKKRAAKMEPDDEVGQAQAEEFEQSEVLVLNVTAKDGRVFAGDDLLHTLITSGLKFGDMNIFHKRLSREHQGSVVFSVANMLNPGTFDLNKMDEFTTLGISFFLALPTPINNLDAFEQMLAVAQHIRDTLGGDLKDDHRNGMTAQTIEHYRQRIRDFELRRLKAVAARG